MGQRFFFILVVVISLLLFLRWIPEQRVANVPADDPSNTRNTAISDATSQDNASEEIIRLEQKLREIIPEFPDAKQLRWLVEDYGNTAVNIANQHGVAGVEVIVALGQQGVAVMREHPDTFDKVAARVGGETAAIFLVQLHKHFKELASLGGLPKLLDRIESLPPELKELGKKYPQMLLFLACSPTATYDALMTHPDLCLVCFPLIDLSQGPEPLERVADLILRYGAQVRPWVEARGLDGILLADTFPSLLEHMSPLDLPVFLEILSNNQRDIQELIANGQGEDVRRTFERLEREDLQLLPPLEEQSEGIRRPRRGDWLLLACIDQHAIRFLTEKGNAAYDILSKTWHESSSTGITLPSLLYDAYSSKDLANLHDHAWDSLTEDRKACQAFQMLYMMSERPGQDPDSVHPRSRRFRQLLAKHDKRVVLYLAEAELNQATTENQYSLLEDRGETHLDLWSEPPSLYVESLPLYDAVQLSCLLVRGDMPTQGEVLFAGIDVAFTVWDIATLGAGKAASASVKGGLKVAGKEVAEQSSQRIAKSVLVKAGGQTGEEAVEKAGRTLVDRMSRSPAVVREIATQGAAKTKFAVNAEKASWSASLKNIPISTLGKCAVREWGINVAVGGSLSVLAQNVAHEDNSLWAQKAKEALLAIDKFLNTPIGR